MKLYQLTVTSVGTETSRGLEAPSQATLSGVEYLDNTRKIVSTPPTDWTTFKKFFFKYIDQLAFY